uniref:Integrase, catalytic region, zinc finger, CCHC-type, peptidase aspartic, catalytic n=1 Tax=Tanacetum cinerariifolium TaxID=118510 RepID=A0A699H342_TANCI|nr:integrase, catalytic region, zinc finger, CCHC-type, peptidase aspartic, catalytic [Tanacetum cinerariifolium]
MKNKKNHVDKTKCNAHVMQSMLNANSVSESVSNALIKHSVKNAKSESLCAICNKCLFDANHDMCLINCRTFTIVGNRCPLTRITSTKIVPPKESTIALVITPTQGIFVYSRRPKASRSIGSSSKVKNVESNTPNSTEPNQSWGSTISDVPSSSFIDFRLSKLFCGYGYYQMGNVIISQVYYVEGLGHNSFCVGQFCDSDLEVAFRKHTCFVHDLEGVDLLKGLRGSNLYTLSLENLMLSSPICLLSKASKTKSWLWHRILSHLNFNYITCYTQNRSLIRKRHNKTPYKLFHDRKPDLSYHHVFGALCYPTNDGEDLDELKLKADIGIFDSGLNFSLLEQSVHDSCQIFLLQLFIAPKHVVSTGSSSTIIDQDAPSTNTSQTTLETPSPVIPLGVKEAYHDIEVAHMDNNPFVEFLIPEPSSEESYTRIYKVKLDELGGLLKNKARLVVRVYRREEWIDFKESFALGMETYEPADTPMVEKSKLDEDPQGKVVDPTHYRGMIGTLMYLIASRPDLMLAMRVAKIPKKSTSGSMQMLGERLQFWYTIKKVQGTNSYEFLLANKKCIVNAKVFRTILDTCPRVEGVHFTNVLDNDIALTFLINLGYKGLLKKHTNMFVDHMHQPWRTLATIINKCISKKLASNDKLKKYRIDILWGMFKREYVDYSALIWEDIAYQIDHMKEKRSRSENMPYPRFTKIIINHFLKQHKSLTNLNHKHHHTIKDDGIVSRLKFVRIGRFNFRITSLTGFLAQSIRSSNADALDSLYLLVLITRTSQSRQHGFPFITVNTKEYHSECSGNYKDNA